MDNELFDRVARYIATISMVKNMLQQGLISEDEYAQIDRIIASDFGLDLSVIYRS